MTKSWIVPSAAPSASTGGRLDAFLRERIPPLLPEGTALSNAKLRRFIIAGGIWVDGRECRRPAFILRPGSRVRAEIDLERLFYEKDPGDIDFTLTERDVLFEDDSIIVVNKPAFLPSEGTVVEGRGSMHRAVIDYLWRRNPSLRNPPYAGIMHRLDRETSGALLFTKTRQVNKAVHDAFEGHLVKKCYRAVTGCSRQERLAGLELPCRFSVDNFIGRVSPKGQACRMGELAPERGGLHAHTDFTLVCGKPQEPLFPQKPLSPQKPQGDGLYYFDCRLGTGRTHQIRLHLALSGFPIVGDELYGGSPGFAENGGRIMLHARLLAFPHPVTGETVSCEAPLPALFAPSC